MVGDKSQGQSHHWVTFLALWHRVYAALRTIYVGHKSPVMASLRSTLFKKKTMLDNQIKCIVPKISEQYYVCTWVEIINLNKLILRDKSF